MAIQSTGLGRGLDALIRDTHDSQEGNGIRMLPLRDIHPNPRQPRRNFNEKALEELATSIRGQGLLQPLLVRPMGASSPGQYEIVAGERRWRACQMAGLNEVPVLVRSFSAQDTLAAALIENIQREDLNPIEEAQGMQILKEEFGLSQDDLAQKLGKSRSAVANSLRLLTLPDSVRLLIADGKLSAGHARALLSVSEPRAQEYLKNLILESKLSVREAEGLASGWKESGTFVLSGVVGNMESVPRADAPATVEEQEERPSGEPVAESMRKTKPQSARILEIQNRIGELYKAPVRVTGKESKGKISFSYNSKEELEALLDRLAQFALEGENRTALAGSTATPLEHAERPSLEGSVNKALEGADMAALDGSGLEPLAGAGHQALDGNRSAALPHQERRALDGAAPLAAIDGGPSEDGDAPGTAET